MFFSGAALAATSPLQQVAVPNAEDLALTVSGRWVIASSLPGGTQQAGALYALDADTGAVHKLYPKPGADGAPAMAGCDSPVTPAAFGPHGIALQSFSADSETLFVVNHGERESIEIFELTEGDSLALTWRGCLILPDHALANAVAVTPDHRVFVTNMGNFLNTLEDEGEAESRWMGEVLVWSEGHSWQSVPDSAVFAPNGLLVSDDGRELYVASWAAGEVIRMTEGAEGRVRHTLALPFLPDNLRWGRENSLVAAGLRGSVEDVVTCVMSPEPCDIDIPTGIARVREDAFELDCLRNIPFQLGTVALPVDETLWVGTVRGDYIWVLDGDRAAWDHCR